jgi:hypothetical protein
VQRDVGVERHADPAGLRRGLQQRLELLGEDAVVAAAQAGDVAARPRAAGDETLALGVADREHDDRDPLRRLHQRAQRRRRAADDQAGLPLHQVGNDGRICPARPS